MFRNHYNCHKKHRRYCWCLLFVSGLLMLCGADILLYCLMIYRSLGKLDHILLRKDTERIHRFHKLIIKEEI